MKIIVSRNSLYSRLKSVGRIVKSGKDVTYSSFLFDITDGALIVTGADELGQIKTKIDCVIEDVADDQFLLDAQNLLSALNELPEQPLELLIQCSTVVINYNKGRFEFPRHEAHLFPTLIQQKNATVITIGSPILHKGFKMFKFASNDELRPMMTTVNFSSKQSLLSFAASTGTHLGVYEQEAFEISDEFDVCIPAKAAKIVSDIMPNTEDIEMSFDGKSIRFEVAEYVATFRLFEGKYPNYRAVIPTSSAITVKVNREELLSAVNRVSIFSSSASSLIILSLKDSNLELRAVDVDYSKSAKETMMLDGVYAPIEIGFNYSFLSDILKAIETDIIEIHLNDSMKAAVFKPLEDRSLLCLLMPLSINQ
jgi:DNA polymerase-3 subunit beta